MNMLKKIASQMNSRARRFIHDDQGATAVEYGLFVAAIAAVIVAVVVALGEKVNTAFTTVKNTLP